MDFPLISVIVPIYNAETFLAGTLDELLKQTYTNLEFILVDDGSTDSSPQICDSYAQKDSRVKVLHQKNSGVCVARNNGIAAAKGEFIGFCDSDDLPDSDLYETLYNIINENNADISMVDVRIVLPDGTKSDTSSGKFEIWEKPEDFVKAFFTQYMNIGVYTKLFKKSVCSQIHFAEGKRINEDMFYFFEAATHSAKTAHKGVAKYTYFRREGSSTLNGFSDKFFDCIYFAEQIKKIVADKFSQYANYAEGNIVSTSLRVLKRMTTMQSTQDFGSQKKQLISNIKSYDRSFCKKYLKKQDYIRYSLLKINFGLFAFVTKHFDRN